MLLHILHIQHFWTFKVHAGVGTAHAFFICYNELFTNLPIVGANWSFSFRLLQVHETIWSTIAEIWTLYCSLSNSGMGDLDKHLSKCKQKSFSACSSSKVIIMIILILVSQIFKFIQILYKNYPAESGIYNLWNRLPIVLENSKLHDSIIFWSTTRQKLITCML